VKGDFDMSLFRKKQSDAERLDFSIVRVNEENYALYDDTVFFRVHNRERTPDERAQPRDFGANLAMLGDKNLRVYAAKAGDRFVGNVAAVFIPKVGHPFYGGRGYLDIDELWTAPAYRRHGIAYALMNEAEHAAKEMGAVAVRLYVGGTNRGAYKLYKKCGYQDRGGGAHWMVKEFM